MFEQPHVQAADAVACADALVASVAAERRAVADRFASVAAWADFHSPGADIDLDHPRGARRPDAAKDSLVGAEGTPPVTPAGVVELGMLLQTSTRSAEVLLRDVLELRHRLPRVWEAILGGLVEGWKGRQVARLTHHLTQDQARFVDAHVVEAVVGQPWGRALAVVEAKVIAADPAAHEERLAAEEHRRYVSTRRGSDAAGLRTLLARGHAGDIARLEAMISHLAAGLQAAGDPDTADGRRATALAMLANPARACLFLVGAHEQTAHDRSETGTTDDGGQRQLAPESGSGGAPSAAELAVVFGRLLQRLGSRALDRLRPRSVLYLHLAAEAVQGRIGCQVARVEAPSDSGPIGTEQLKAWLGHDRVTVKPVLDPTGVEPVDCYEIPRHLREAVHLMAPYEVFPYGTLPARGAVDLDHPTPYRHPHQGGPPGQTGIHNLGPLGRRHHRVKTFDSFTVHQLATNLYLWRSPTGHWYRVDHRGTAYLGHRRPEAVDVLKRVEVGADKREPPTRIERRFRETILRHVAA